MAKAALEATDAADKTELTTKIDEADAALQAAINALSAELDDVRSELLAKTNDLQLFIIIVCIISGIALCGGSAFIIWFFIDRKRRTH